MRQVFCTRVNLRLIVPPQLLLPLHNGFVSIAHAIFENKLYPILDTLALARRGCPLRTAASAFLGAGARILQIRNKLGWTRELLSEAEAVRELCTRFGAQLVIND